jgi:hypothetical protein
MMRTILASLLVAALPAWAQAPAPPPPVPDKAAATCPECGVVRSVRAMKKELAPNANTESKPSGLVATIPFGKGAGKPEIGSSSKVGKDAVSTIETWEVTIRLDDGRYRLLTMDERPDLREGDKVRVEPNGQVKRRD